LGAALRSLESVQSAAFMLVLPADTVGFAALSVREYRRRAQVGSIAAPLGPAVSPPRSGRQYRRRGHARSCAMMEGGPALSWSYRVVFVSG
jgi:hypothetical protein